MTFDIKKYLPSIIKSLIIFGTIIFLLWLIWLSGITKLLLEDKKPKSFIDEGKYILNKLAEDYEEYLKAKRAYLDKEAKFLLSEQGMNKTLSEKQAIARRLKTIENEKKILNEEYLNNLKRKAELETNILSLESTLSLSGKEISSLSEEYRNLSDEKEKTESYWKNYINDIFLFFSGVQNDPDKKNEIQEKFKVNNGKDFIKEEFASLFSKVNKQEYTLTENKNKEKKMLDENADLESKLKEYEQTLQYYGKFSEFVKKFQNMLVYYNNANNAFKQKNFEKSSSEYKKVINELEEISSSYEGLIQSEKELQNIIARKHIDAGLALMKSKHFSRASDSFKLALKDAPLSDYTDDAMKYIFKIAFQYKDVERIAKANLSAKIIMDKAKNHFRSKRYKEALKEYYNIIINYPISDYTDAALDRSNEIKEILLQEKVENFNGVVKKNFSYDYRKFESIYFSGDMEKARSFYFEALQDNFGNYSKNTIYKFKEVEDTYVESLLKNYENQLIALKVAESASVTPETSVKEKNSLLDSLFGKNENKEIKEDQIVEPEYTVLKNTLLKADGIGGKDTYELIQSAFGDGILKTPDYSFDQNDVVHKTLKHITKGVDSGIGNYFKFIVHRDLDKVINSQNKSSNSSRIYLQKNSNKNALAGLGESVRYSWKFKINKDMRVSKEMTLFFEIKSDPSGGELLNQGMIKLDGTKINNKDMLQLTYFPKTERKVLADVSWDDVKGKWLTADCIISFKNNGYLYFNLKDHSGKDVLSYENDNINMWKTGADIFCPIWGIYRRLEDAKNLREEEDSVFFADISVEKIKLSGGKKNSNELSFKENFNSTPLGQLPRDWVLNSKFTDQDVYAGVVDSKTIKPYSMPNCLKLFDNSNNLAAKILKEIGAHDFGQIKFYFYSSEELNSELYFHLKSDNKNSNDESLANLININFLKGDIKILSENNQRISVGTYKQNEWNEVLVKYDAISGFYNFECNKVKMGKYKLIEKNKPYSINFQGGLVNSGLDRYYKGITVFIDDIEFTADKKIISK